MPEATPECDWSATDPATGRFHAVNKRSDVQELIERVESLREQGSGYVEVSHPEQPFPWLALSFTGQSGVVHQFSSPERSLLLRGDGSVSSDRLVDVPVFEELHPFSGYYVSRTDRALDIVTRFVAGAEPTDLGDWELL